MLEELKEKDRLVEYLQARPTAPRRPSRRRRAEGQLSRRVPARGPLRHRGRAGRGRNGDRLSRLRPGDRRDRRAQGASTRAGQLRLDAPRRFKQELRLARRITHRNVVRTYDLGETNGIYYITMEYVRGTSLATLIREAGEAGCAPAALTIGKQLCRALEVAHEEGIVHRDIKPQNLLVEPSGFLKVMDFGIARLAEGQRASRAP